MVKGRARAPWRVVLVGQAPYRGGDPTKPLTGRTGKKLAKLAGLKFPVQYARTFELRNVLDFYPGRSPHGKGDAFPLVDARMAADELVRELSGRTVVMLGQGVARAFRIPGLPFLNWHVERGIVWGLMPHPSPIVRWWNIEENVERAREFLGRAAELSREACRAHRRFLDGVSTLAARIP